MPSFVRSTATKHQDNETRKFQKRKKDPGNSGKPKNC